MGSRFDTLNAVATLSYPLTWEFCILSSKFTVVLSENKGWWKASYNVTRRQLAANIVMVFHRPPAIRVSFLHRAFVLGCIPHNVERALVGC